MRGTVKSWEGGYIRENAKGRGIYIIRRRVAGTQYEFSTRATTLRAAMEQLKRFEADPANYDPSGPEEKDAIFLDARLAEAFLTYCRDVKENTQLWLGKQKGYVAWWAGKLKGVDLRKASLSDHIKPALRGTKAKPHRIATIKAVYSWLRTVEHSLTANEDPTFGTLPVPQSDPKKRRIKNKAVPKEHYILAREHLAGHWRDALDLQAGTGWHITEVQRFAVGGYTEPYPVKGVAGVAGVLVCPEAKTGGELRTPVSAAALDAANRLRERGTFDPTKYGLAVKAACKAAGLKAPFTPGRLRHSVATWAIDNGADPAMVSAFLNHKNPRTTRKFYANFAVPSKVPTLI